MVHMEHKVLFVDDEKDILELFRKSFSEEPFEILTADNEKDGLELISKNEISVVIADVRLAEMKGVGFLKKAKLEKPDVVTMVLSSCSEIKEILYAINEGHVWRYLGKPWENDALSLDIRNALEYYENKIETKKLLMKVAKQNEELLTNKKDLEVIINKRTVVIQIMNQILEMTLKYVDSRTTLRKSCKLIVKLDSLENVYIYPKFLEEYISNQGAEVASYIDVICDKALLTESTVLESTVVAHPLVNDNELIGVFIFEFRDKAGVSDANLFIEEFSNILTLIILEFKNLTESGGVLESIDRVMAEI